MFGIFVTEMCRFCCILGSLKNACRWIKSKPTLVGPKLQRGTNDNKLNRSRESIYS